MSSSASQSGDSAGGASDPKEPACCKCLRPCTVGSIYGEPGSFGSRSKQHVHEICARVYKMGQRKQKARSYKAMVLSRPPEEQAAWYPYDVPYGQGPVHTALLGELLLGELLLGEVLLALRM